MTKSYLSKSIITLINVTILLPHFASAAASKAGPKLTGSVTIEAPTCGNQPQVGKGCAIKSRPAYNINLHFSNLKTGAQFEIRTDQLGLINAELPAGTYMISIDGNPLIHSLSESQIEIREGIINQTRLIIIEKIQ